jgi:hypothetical protein
MRCAVFLGTVYTGSFICFYNRIVKCIVDKAYITSENQNYLFGKQGKVRLMGFADKTIKMSGLFLKASRPLMYHQER